MIANVAPRKASGAEKTYAVTNLGETVMSGVASATAGQYVSVYSPYSTSVGIRVVTAQSGISIPYRPGNPSPISTQAEGSSYYFVMPAEDVTIS